VAQVAGRQWQQVQSRLAQSPSLAIATADAIPQLLALAMAGLVIAMNRPPYSEDLAISLVIAIGLAGLRVAAGRSEPVPTTYVLDAAGVALLIGGTGAAQSAFYGLALAGAWWAARQRGQGLVYGAAFMAAYVILVVPGAARDADIAATIYQPALVAVVGLLGDRLSGWRSYK
jgi:hypothetical protein